MFFTFGFCLLFFFSVRSQQDIEAFRAEFEKRQQCEGNRTEAKNKDEVPSMESNEVACS